MLKLKGDDAPIQSANGFVEAYANAKKETVKEIIKKYKKHFETANAAGMTEEEAINMMGTIQSIVSKYIDDDIENNKDTTINIPLNAPHVRRSLPIPPPNGNDTFINCSLSMFNKSLNANTIA